MRALLDVNLLIALVDAAHVFHERAHAWWAEHSHWGWASCPITENGVIRIMSSPAYRPDAPLPPADLIARLRTFAEQSDHEFWSETVSFRDATLFRADRLHRSREITDCWLLALAVRRQGRLVTFDQGIALTAIIGAQPQHLLVV